MVRPRSSAFGNLGALAPAFPPPEGSGELCEHWEMLGSHGAVAGFELLGQGEAR